MEVERISTRQISMLFWRASLQINPELKFNIRDLGFPSQLELLFEYSLLPMLRLMKEGKEGKLSLGNLICAVGCRWWLGEGDSSKQISWSGDVGLLASLEVQSNKVKSKWNRSALEVKSMWHRSEAEVKSKWSRIEIKVKSKRNRSEFEVKSKWLLVCLLGLAERRMEHPAHFHWFL